MAPWQTTPYLTDGVTNRDLWMNYLVIMPIADTIQEVRVLANNYSADYGEAAGAARGADQKRHQ